MFGPCLLALTAFLSMAAGSGTDVRVNCATSFDQAEVSIHVDPFDGQHLVAAAIDWSSGAQSIAWFTSFDRGATWSCGVLAQEPGYIAACDPDLVFDVHGGVHLVALQLFGPGGNGVFVYHSTDRGITFPSSTKVNVSPDNDKPLFALDLTPGASYGRIVLTYMRVDFATGTNARILVSTSSDDGQTFSPAVRINNRNANGNLMGYFPKAAIGPAGEIFVAWVDVEMLQVMFDRSLDGGATWHPDRVVASYVNPPDPLPGLTFTVRPVVAIDADRSHGSGSGSVYVAFHTWDTSGAVANANVLCATSRDQGFSWTTAIVHPGDTLPTDQVYPALAVDRLGGVEVTWLDRRASSGGASLEQWGSRSVDGGATFVETRLSDAPFDPINAQNGGLFIGHYEGLEADDSHAFACWADARLGSDYLDVWLDPWQFDLSADVATISVATGGTANLAITPGPALAGDGYLVVGSASGTTPGFDLGSVHVPLNWDALTSATVVLANGSFLQNTLGSLDPTGSASAAIDTQGPLPPLLAGITLDFTVVTFDPTSGRIVHATAPVSIALVP
jgi:hypothetical protein